VVLRLGYRLSITKFKALSSSEYAPLVRQIEFNPRPFLEERPDVVDRLPSLLANFLNLNFVDFWSLEWEEESIETWFPAVLESIAKPQFRRLTRLRFPIRGSGYLAHCLKSGHHTKVTQLIRQIERLSLTSRTEEDDPYLEGLDTLLETATNLFSLKVGGFCEAFDLPVGDINCSQPLRLKSLNLERVYISSYELLGLLERCKDTVRSVKIDYVSLNAGSWLHVLTQIKKNLKLFDFLFFDWVISLDKELRLSDTWPDYGFFRRDYKLICLAIGDSQRQINANRLAEGFKRRSKKKFRALDFPPLESVMEKGRYTKLISQSWDAEKNNGYHSDPE
jgi:hypothetical protein